MHHCKMLYDSWYKGCSYKNKLCRNKHFSLSWFIIALISNKSRLNIVSLLKNRPSVSDSWVKSLRWWYGLREEIQTDINSLDHLLFRRDVSMSWNCSGVTHFIYVPVYSDYCFTHGTKGHPTHSSRGFLRKQPMEIHRLKTISSYHFTSVKSEIIFSSVAVTAGKILVKLLNWSLVGSILAHRKVSISFDTVFHFWKFSLRKSCRRRETTS